jgi:hypothetical protein
LLCRVIPQSLVLLVSESRSSLTGEQVKMLCSHGHAPLYFIFDRDVFVTTGARYSAINLCRMPRKSKMHQLPDYVGCQATKCLMVPRVMRLEGSHCRSFLGHPYSRMKSIMHVSRNVTEKLTLWVRVPSPPEAHAFVTNKWTAANDVCYRTPQGFHGCVAPDRLAYSGFHHRETHISAQRPLLGGCLRP